jgi:hypothetical protein
MERSSYVWTVPGAKKYARYGQATYERRDLQFYQDSTGEFQNLITHKIKMFVFPKMVTWDSTGLQIFCAKRNKNGRLQTGYSAHKGIITKNRVFCNDRKLYMVLRGRWCDISGLNAHAPTVDENVDPKDVLYSLSTYIRNIS